jgi:hypothetical protein
MDKLSKKALKEQYKNRSVSGGVYFIKCSEGGLIWLRATMDLQGAKNRFIFSKSMDSCPENSMREAWLQFGADAFSFEVAEEIMKKDTQTEAEFSEDVNVLLEMWQEKEKGGDFNG